MQTYPIRKEANQEKLVARDLEANPQETEAISEQQQVPNKETDVGNGHSIEDQPGYQTGCEIPEHKEMAD